MAPEPKQLSTTLGFAMVVPVQYFLEHVLPPLHPRIDLERTLSKLKRGTRSHRPITKAGRWWGFSDDPESTKHSRKTSFLNFPRMVNAIAECGAPAGVQSSLEILFNPHQGITSVDRDEQSLPDAYLVTRGTQKSEVGWGDISVAGEYDKGSWGRLDNEARLCWSIANMFEDPRRRFAFGYSVENTDMRLWFCDRTQLIVSELFNFATEHKTVIHIFLSFLYSEPHQLGWDTSIQMVKDPRGDSQYEFAVTSIDGSTSVFRSLELIAGDYSSRILGGGTRVWKVVRIVDGAVVGEAVVLKDTWTHEELAAEGTSLGKIRSFDDSENFQRAFSAHFLTVLCHGDVVLVSQDGLPQLDRTRHHRRNFKAYRKKKALPDPGPIPPRPRPAPPPVFVTESVLSGCKAHYRIVFKEVCKPLGRESPLVDVFVALEQTCGALSLLHRAGWVHRDISKGNIMVDDSGHVRLTDLEYAKPMDDENIPELKVGTAPFISSEVMDQHYKCKICSPPPSVPHANGGNEHADESAPRPKPQTLKDSTDEIHRLARELQRRAKGYGKIVRAPRIPLVPRTPSPSQSPPPFKLDNDFRYNPLHDLESVFWLATYFIFTTTGYNQDEEEIKQQEHIKDRLLYDDFQHSCVMRLDDAFLCDVSYLHPDLHELALSLEELRSKLVTRFRVAEKDCGSITSSVATGLHESLASVLHKMAGQVVVDKQADAIPATEEFKRGRSLSVY